MPSIASLPTVLLYMNIFVILLIGNASASTEWCRRQPQSPPDWICLDATSIFPTCCPPGSVCLSSICEPNPSTSSDSTEPTSSDWYAPCFYPNGDLEPKDMPCSSQGGACCPGRWECLSNGLCYNDYHYERHTCIDQALGPSCPQICEMQYGSSANASEDGLMCGASGTSGAQVLGCCNGEVGGTGSCCDSATASTFALASGHVVTSLRDTPSAWESFLKSSARTTSIQTSSATSTFTTITSNLNGVISTIVSTAFITAAPTSASGSSIPTSSALAPVESVTSEPTSSRPMAAILGTAIGIPLGLIALIAFLIILYRHRKYNVPGGRTPEIYFPPDPIYNPATKVLPRVGLDATPKAIYEMDGKVAPSELGSSTRVVVDAKEASAAVYELDATVHASPEPSNRISAVSSLLPVVQHHHTGSGAASTSSRLQIVSQQHYGSAQSQFLIPEDLYRLDRPLSGTLPAAQAARSDSSEISLIPRPIADGEQGGNGEKAIEGETAHDVYESKHVVLEEAHEEVKEIHEVTRTERGTIPDEVFRTDGDDNANEEKQAQAGESR